MPIFPMTIAITDDVGDHGDLLLHLLAGHIFVPSEPSNRTDGRHQHCSGHEMAMGTELITE